MISKLYTPLDTLFLVVELHKGQKDKVGRPYVHHLFRVWGLLGKYQLDDELVAIALLHDAVEDSQITYKRLKELGYSERIVKAVRALSKRKGEDYFNSYLPRVVKNRDAVIVKWCDLEDNSNPDRLAQLPKKDANRLRKKYEKAKKFIETTCGVPDLGVEPGILEKMKGKR